MKYRSSSKVTTSSKTSSSKQNGQKVKSQKKTRHIKTAQSTVLSHNDVVRYRKSRPKAFTGNTADNVYVLFNKPYHVLCQFTDESSTKQRKTLKDYIDIPDIYAAGRLDYDSEGLLLLTNDGKLIHQMSSPKHKTEKVYWVQVEGVPSESSLVELRSGIVLKDGKTAPAKVEKIDEPLIWPRNPPIRERKSIPTTWLKIGITEGRNRQVRRMTAHIGHPTLRLIRHSIGNYTIDGIANGEFKRVNS